MPIIVYICTAILQNNLNNYVMTKKVLVALLRQRVRSKIESFSSKVSLDPEGYDSGYNDGYSDGLTELLEILEDYD